MQIVSGESVWERARVTSGVLAGGAGLVWASVDFSVRTLLVMQALDIVSGLVAAWVTCRLESRAGWAGVGRKLLVWCGVAAAAVVAPVLGAVTLDLPSMGQLQVPPVGLAQAFALYYAAVEVVSVAENLKRGGVGLPSWITSRLGQFQASSMGAGVGAAGSFSDERPVRVRRVPK